MGLWLNKRTGELRWISDSSLARQLKLEGWELVEKSYQRAREKVYFTKLNKSGEYQLFSCHNTQHTLERLLRLSETAEEASKKKEIYSSIPGTTVPGEVKEKIVNYIYNGQLFQAGCIVQQYIIKTVKKGSPSLIQWYKLYKNYIKINIDQIKQKIIQAILRWRRIDNARADILAWATEELGSRRELEDKAIQLLSNADTNTKHLLAKKLEKVFPRIFLVFAGDIIIQKV